MDYSETVLVRSGVRGYAGGEALADRPKIGVLVDDPGLISWLSGSLDAAFILVADEPDRVERAGVAVYLLDHQALARHIGWLRTTRVGLSPDSIPVLLLSDDQDEVAADVLSLVDARIPVTLSRSAFCEQIMHWVHFQASAQLWTLTASGAYGQPAQDRLLPVETLLMRTVRIPPSSYLLTLGFCCWVIWPILRHKACLFVMCRDCCAGSIRPFVRCAVIYHRS